MAVVDQSFLRNQIRREMLIGGEFHQRRELRRWTDEKEHPSAIREILPGVANECRHAARLVRTDVARRLDVQRRYSKMRLIDDQVELTDHFAEEITALHVYSISQAASLDVVLGCKHGLRIDVDRDNP